MKKSVVILIGVIYIAAIALVSFFGLQFKVFEEIVDVEFIELLDKDNKMDYSDYLGGNYIVVPRDANGEASYQIEYRVHPDNATNQGVNFVYDEVDGISVDENGVVKFAANSAENMLTVIIVAKDGTNKQAKLTVIAQ